MVRYPFLLSLLYSLLLVSLSGIAGASDGERFEYNRREMGVPVRLIVIAPNETVANAGAEDVFAMFERLNAVMSDYDPESEIIRICRRAGETGETVPVSDDLRRVLAASRFFNERTHGAFDITVSPVVKLWRRSRMFKKPPPREYLEEAIKLVGNDRWSLDEKGVKVAVNGVRFDVGGIAKGYALDRALEILRRHGIVSALVDAGGDVRLGDAPPGRKGWTIGFASLAQDAKAAVYLDLANVGIASSGDTFRFVEIDSVRYSHLIDPRCGRPMTVHRVVSIVSTDATTADALASAVSILDPKEGLAVVRSFPGTDALVFQRDGNDKAPQTLTYRTALFETARTDPGESSEKKPLPGKK